MQVVLLAAGLGSRLGPLTERLPKALIPVAGDTLLARAVRFARLLQPTQIVVVGGFGYPEVAAEVARRKLPVTLVRNPDFRDGNLVSLLAARPNISTASDFLLMNVDHIYRPAVAERVATDGDGVTAFVHQNRPLDADDMRVAPAVQGRVRVLATHPSTSKRVSLAMQREAACVRHRRDRGKHQDRDEPEPEGRRNAPRTVTQGGNAEKRTDHHAEHQERRHDGRSGEKAEEVELHAHPRAGNGGQHRQGQQPIRVPQDTVLGLGNGGTRLGARLARENRLQPGFHETSEGPSARRCTSTALD